MTLSFSFQYQFKAGDIGKVYREFGEQYESRFILFARMAISDVAQQYTPQMFWKARSKVALEMFNTLKKSLRANGHCDVVQFQLLQVDFPVNYEKMITDIQLQVQYKLTAEYQQQVTNILKNVEVLTAKNDAAIAVVKAKAAATSSVLVNAATAQGFYATQQAKAEAYAELRSMLGLSNAEIVEYVKIRSLTHSGPQTVVGTAAPSMVNA